MKLDLSIDKIIILYACPDYFFAQPFFSIVVIPFPLNYHFAGK